MFASRFCCRATMLGIFVIFFSLATSAQESVDANILQRISKAKNELQNVQRKISEQSRVYAQKLDEHEREIKALRAQVATQQRMADEQLLSLDKLKERVEQWETRSNYQSQMLRHFGDVVGLSAEMQKQDDPLANIVQYFESAADPQWRTIRIIFPGGKVAEAPVLKLGPVQVALETETKMAGPLVREPGLEPQALDVWDSDRQAGLWQLQEQGFGYIPFDPTLGNALQLRGSGSGIVEHLRKGGVWALPIVFFGFLSLLIAIFKGGQLMRLPKVNDSLLSELKDAGSVQTSAELPLPARQSFEKAGTAQRKLVQIAFAHPVSQQRDDLLVANLMEHKHQLEKYMGVVALSAAVAPLLGLLGTVSGMIDTFKMMTIFGSGDASTVSGGISEALITTELGLIVAIPSLLISALLSRQIKNHMHRLENFAIKLSKLSFT